MPQSENTLAIKKGKDTLSSTVFLWFTADGVKILMRDTRQVLERWGAWAANNHEDVTWSPIAAGFKRLIPEKVKSRPQCCDDDAMIICGCMARLNRNNSDLHDLLVDYYVLGETFMALARKHGCSDTCIGKRLHKAEGIVEGMLMMLGVRLEMDRYVECELPGGRTSVFYQRKNSLRS